MQTATSFKVVALGGGTGLPIVITSFKGIARRVAIVNMVDDGRSTGIIREAFDFPAVGDLRNTLVAFAENKELAELFTYRFSEGFLKNHPLGNLAILAASKENNLNLESAIEYLSAILKVDGEVVPMTYDMCNIAAELKEGTIISGQVRVSSSEGIRRIWVVPDGVKLNPRVVENILTSDWIILGPGSLYSSLLPVLSFKEVGDSLRKTSAKKIFIMNLANELREAKGMTAIDHLNALFDHAGRFDLDYLICHNHKFYPLNIEEPVVDDTFKLRRLTGELIIGDFANDEIHKLHSVKKLRGLWLSILGSEKKGKNIGFH